MKKSSRIMMISVLMLVIMVIMSVCVFADTEWKPTENQDKYEGLVCGLGMFSAAAKGTEITINNDGTATLNITTKPMVSTKYTKAAFSLEEFGSDGKDTGKMEEAAAGIAVTVCTADDNYVGQFDGVDYGTKPFYWSVFSYTMPVEAMEKPIYTAGYNVLVLKDSATKTYEEDLDKAKWAYSSTWTVKATPELISSLRNKQMELGESEVAARIGKVAEHFEAEYAESLAEAARQAIAAAKADLNNKALIEEALAACEKLSDDQKAAFAEDIKILQDAKAGIERKEKEAEEKKKAIAKVQAGSISGFKAAAGRRKVTFTWKKNTVFAGYQLKYKVGTKSKTVLIKNVKTLKKVVKKLKKGKKVTAQIRGYKNISGTRYYGKWEKSKVVKVK